MDFWALKLSKVVSFKAIKFSKVGSFMAVKFCHPNTLKEGEFQGPPKTLRI